MSELTPLDGNTQFDELVEFVSQNYDALTQYTDMEFSQGRRRGYFEPGGVASPIVNKRRRLSDASVMMEVDNMGTRGSTSFAQKKMPRKTYKRQYKKTKSLSAKMKTIALRTHEIKNYNLGNSAALLHAQQQAFNICAGITQGTSLTGRIGDEITLNAFRAQILCQAPATAGAYSYRIQLLYSGEEYSNTSFSTTTLAFSEVFLSGAVAGFNVGGVVNKKAVTVLYDQVVTINSNVASTADAVHFPCNINLRNVKFPYQSGGSALGKFKNLYFLVTPWVAGGTVSVTSCGNVFVNFSLDYRDA